jgi:hypothetical protein
MEPAVVDNVNRSGPVIWLAGREGSGGRRAGEKQQWRRQDRDPGQPAARALPRLVPANLHSDNSSLRKPFQRSADRNLLKTRHLLFRRSPFMKKIVRNRLREAPSSAWGASVRKSFSIHCCFRLRRRCFRFGRQDEALNFKPQFVFKVRNGKTVSTPIVDDARKKKLVYRRQDRPAPEPDITAPRRSQNAPMRIRCVAGITSGTLASGAVDSG